MILDDDFFFVGGRGLNPRLAYIMHYPYQSSYAHEDPR